MQRNILSVLTVTLALAFAGLPSAEATPPSDVIVAFRSLPSDRSSYGGEPVVAANEALRFFVVHSGNRAALERRGAHDQNVLFLEADAEQYHATLVPNDSFYASQYDMKPGATNMELAWNRTLGSTAVKVCVVDTGLYTSHADLQGLSLGGWKDFVRGKPTPYDDNGHGTHVTGTIAAVLGNGKGVAGIAQVTIYSAKVLGKSGSGTISAVASAFQWCTDQGVDIISASLGGGVSSTLESAVNYADAAGVLQVAATGNDGPCTSCVGYPAAYAPVVAVGCSDASNALCSFSSQGPQVDLTAPGKDIWSLWPKNVSPCRQSNGNACYVRISGTSMSTPHVAGLAALVKSANSTLDKDGLFDALKSTARDLGPSGFDNQFGWGLIQGDAVPG